MSDEKSVAGWVVDHISAFAWLAISGFGFYAYMENGMRTALGASWVGCLALAGFGFAAGVNVGSWLVRHFEAKPANKALEDASRQIESLTDRGARERAEHESQASGLRAAIDNERRKNAELARRWDREEERRKAAEQRDADADRLLKLSWPEYAIIDGILTAEANGGQYRSQYSEALGHLYASGVIEDFGAGDVYMIKMGLRPFFERYADAIHEVATGTNEDRVRVAERVRQGAYVVDGRPIT